MEAQGVLVPNNTGSSSSNYTLSPFLHGPRSCMGTSFAKGKFVGLLATRVGCFEFELVGKALINEAKLKFNGSVTIKPCDCQGRAGVLQ